ncbi:class I SAM-dependent methyltransferase [Azospirillum sp. B506]|uniref:class I SAM-dependent methyltransferase n=1 Tax=Azospirillum sp. B506 TaxID=137721 RepID=UPI0003473632|nr:class I SAM-dependent methyltransferase [Azospirillum sp. B506]
MEKEYFVDDYEKLVAALKSVDPIDVAMSKAVGGAYEMFGQIECQVLEQHGLANGMSVFDFGCGSGRLSTALSQKWEIEYLGVDVVEDLLRFAASKAPQHYRFILNHALSLPVPDAFADICCAFSVFTHLRHEDSYLYLTDLVRAAKPGGRIIFSFLEFASSNHWTIFIDTVRARRHSVLPHMNVFIERNAISRWAAHLGCPEVDFIDSHDPRWNGHAMGQSIAVLTKPAA